MTLEWQAAWQAVVHHPLFCFGITLGAYQLAMWAYQKTRWMFVQPVLLATALVICVLLLADIRFPEYIRDVHLLSVFLGPTTVALAVPLFMNLRRIRQMFWPIVITLVLGGVVATLSGIGLAWAFGIEHSMLMSLAPKSATSPIAMLVAEEIGGIASLAAVFVLVAGVLGAMFGVEVMRRFGIVHPVAMGFSLGIVSHAVGTSRALQEGEECGAFAALGMSLMGVSVALFLPLAMALFI